MLLFGALELYLRGRPDFLKLDQLTGRKPTPNPMSEWAVPDPFCVYAGRPGKYPGGKTVSAQGFISTPDIALQKPEGCIRIVFLGGSSTAGTGVNLADEETWPWKVAEQVRRRSGKCVEFINAAMGGSTYESYGRLWSRLRFYKPDIIVVYHGWNDMYYFNDEYAADPTKWRRDFDLYSQTLNRQLEPH